MTDTPALSARLREEARTLSARKLYNVLMCAVQLKLKSARLLYLPTRISIETGNICNLRCPLCPTGRRDEGVARGFMQLDDYKKIIDQLYRDLLLVRLYNWGEPLLNKNLQAMIGYARRRRTAVTVSTNLNTLDADQAEALLKAGLQKIFVSCDGLSEKTYTAYHAGGDFRRVMDNIALLAALKRRLDGCGTRIIWLFHVFRHNEHEVADALRKARELGVEIRVNMMRTDMGQEIFETAEQAIERDRDWIPEDPRYCAFDLETKQAKKKKNFCALPWKETVVNWDGAVLPCCSVYQEKYSLGNAFEQGFRAVWNGPAYRAVRRELAGRPNTGTTVCHICKANGFTFF